MIDINKVYCGDCLGIVKSIPDDFVDIIVTSPPYWGQRMSDGIGVEPDPRDYLKALVERFNAMKRVLKPSGIMWINIGDAYNTPVNWDKKDTKYSSLGKDESGLAQDNSAYTKPRHQRKAFTIPDVPWLKYGNLLALPQRLVVALADDGWFYRGEVMWQKANPLPEGKCRRPHRTHEGIYLFAKNLSHDFRISPSVKSVWEFANEQTAMKHGSRFPKELPKRCIEAYGKTGKEVIVMDPYSGTATTGMAAISLGCSYIGIEIDQSLVDASSALLRTLLPENADD